jgi:hypothetical protein
MTYVLILGAPEEMVGRQDLALSWGIRPVEPAAVVDQEFEGPMVGTAPGQPAAATPPAPPPPPPSRPQPRLLGEPVTPQD